MKDHCYDLLFCRCNNLNAHAQSLNKVIYANGSGCTPRGYSIGVGFEPTPPTPQTKPPLFANPENTARV